MSTIDQILNNLRDTSQEKARGLEAAYTGHSLWLQRELQLLRQIIQQNPRDCPAAKTEAAQSICAPPLTVSAPVAAAASANTSAVAAPANATASTSSASTASAAATAATAVGTAAEAGPKKRKSSDRERDEKMSPEAKRASLDFESLLRAAGLPSNPQKMKKEELLAELERRGSTGFSMKNKKDVLVEALKDCLFAEQREKGAADALALVYDEPAKELLESDSVSPAESQKSVAAAANATNAVAERETESERAAAQPEKEEVKQTFAAPPTTPARKGSLLLQDLRSQLQKERETESEAANNAQREKTESAFQNRYRASQIRKSQLVCPAEPAKETEAQREAPTGTLAKCETQKESEREKDVPTELSTEEQTSTEREGESESSPQPEQRVAETLAAAEAPQESPAEPVSESAPVPEGRESDAEAVHDATWTEVCSPIREAERESDADDEEGESEEETPSELGSTASSSKSFTSSLSSSLSSSLEKKPSNLQAQGSFLEKSKPVVPALEKAKQLKLLEEQKALKKKEQSSKMPSAVQTVSKILSPPWKSKPQNSTKEGKDVKKGLFNLFSKKDKEKDKEKEKEKEGRAEVSSINLKQIKENEREAEKQKEIAKDPIVAKPVQIPTNTAVAQKPAAVSSSQTKEVTATKNEISAPARPISAAAVKPSEQKPLQQSAPVTSGSNNDNDDDFMESNEYPIEDRPSSEDEGSGTDNEEEKRQKQERIPDWAHGPKLREALERQFGLNGGTPMDPDLIFPEVQTCSLEEIFGQRQGITRKYANRTSSAHWDADQLTLVEKRQYRNHMGYGGINKMGSSLKT